MIYSYQQKTYDSLLAALRAHQVGLTYKLPVTPRNHRLVIGPTGSGKTHLAEAAAKELGWACYTINAGGWIIMGAKETPSWKTLFQWASTVIPGRPVVLVIDEVDKVYSTDSWSRYLQSELYCLMDRRIPAGLEADSPGGTRNAYKVLREALIVGCGAFQGIWDQHAPVGFGSKMPPPPDASDLHKSLQAELVNRFSEHILRIPAPTEEDYLQMAADILPDLPDELVPSVSSIAARGVKQAVKDRSAARFIEAVLSEALAELASANPPPPWRPRMVRAEPVPPPEEIDEEECNSWEIP